MTLVPGREQTADVLSIGLDGVRLAGRVNHHVGAQCDDGSPCPWSRVRPWSGGSPQSAPASRPSFSRVVDQHADKFDNRDSQ